MFSRQAYIWVIGWFWRAPAYSDVSLCMFLTCVDCLWRTGILEGWWSARGLVTMVTNPCAGFHLAGGKQNYLQTEGENSHVGKVWWLVHQSVSNQWQCLFPLDLWADGFEFLSVLNWIARSTVLCPIQFQVPSKFNFEISLSEMWQEWRGCSVWEFQNVPVKALCF